MPGEIFSIPLGLFFVGLLGLVVGSFLNVVIYRLPIMMDRAERHYAKMIIEGESGEEGTQMQKFNLLYPPSACPKCKHAIQFWQNIPILSYLLQRGKCVNCGTSISIRYLLVELLTAVLSVLVALKYPELITLGFALLFTWSLIALAFIDAEHQILPDVITLPLLWLALLAAVFGYIVDLQTAVIGAMIGYLSLWIVYWIFKLLTGREGMGYGDFKLLAALCAWQGAMMLPIILFLSAILGLIFALLSRLKQGIPIAFGPFLAIAGWITFMYGERLSGFLM